MKNKLFFEKVECMLEYIDCLEVVILELKNILKTLYVTKEFKCDNSLIAIKLNDIIYDLYNDGMFLVRQICRLYEIDWENKTRNIIARNQNFM